ncbi:cytochrome oxidase putative small subunit CydP [Pseudoduganella sp. HUAS MS19]
MKPPAGHSLALAITVALAVKVLLLYGLWYAFFSHPQTTKMRLPAGQVESHLLSAPAKPGEK